MRQRLVELFEYMDRTRADLLATVAEANSTLSSVRARDGEWSVAEIMSHLAVVEQGVAGLVAKSIKWAKENGIPPETDDTSIVDGVNFFSQSKKRIAPDMVLPRADSPLEESLAALAHTRTALKAALAEGDGLDLSVVKRKHPSIGELNIYHWALFVAQHEARHSAQIERTIKEVTGRAAECAPIV
ncbi:MAG TPA: DinB family protein [Gemmatimonadaceae bacterium]|nr:DinB family protein [Gemmatimonadaceae bacterium]